MNNFFENGAIVAGGKYFEDVKYDVSNYTLSACFSGFGGVDYYLPVNEDAFAKPISFASISYNGQMQDVLLDKKVTMLGRNYTVEIKLGKATLKAEQFLDRSECGVFTLYTLDTEDKDDIVEIGLFGDFFSELKLDGKTTLKAEKRVFSADSEFDYISENQSIIFKLSGDKQTFFTRMIFGSVADKCNNTADKAFYEKAAKELNSVTPPEHLTENEKALYNSAYWCALENYKELGDYKAFMAGCRYLAPMRTYYRDSYYTVLPMYRNNVDKVKNQIISLARGIGDDGSCPSAVKCDFGAWWGDHYDSPSFFVMMLHDYISFSGDIDFADFNISGSTIFEKAIAAIEHLSKYADKTGLLLKDGKYNKRDWADEVNRYGYVTYDELLYARALFCIAEIFEKKNVLHLANEYKMRYEKVKKAINELLWDEEKGYFVNFKNEDYTEDNLSIDTVFAAIFDIADTNRSERMLLNMESMLETKNGRFGDDFGSMCVYPFYKKTFSARNKSTQSFNYHNGANWPYLSAMYAYAKRKFNMDYKQLLTVPFEYNLKKSNYTPIEYFSPFCKDGSMLQAWSGASAFVLDEELSKNFWNKTRSV